MKPALVCCEAWTRPGSAGLRWSHAKDCPTDPGGLVVPIRPSVRETRHLRVVQASEDARAAVPTVSHPAGKGSWGKAVSTWMAHNPGCECWECGYVEAHLEDAR